MSGGLEAATILEPCDQLGEGGILFINEHGQFIHRRVLREVPGDGEFKGAHAEQWLAAVRPRQSG
jgi:hypothetical protein